MLKIPTFLLYNAKWENKNVFILYSNIKYIFQTICADKRFIHYSEYLWQSQLSHFLDQRWLDRVELGGNEVLKYCTREWSTIRRHPAAKHRLTLDWHVVSMSVFIHMKYQTIKDYQKEIQTALVLLIKDKSLPFT